MKERPVRKKGAGSKGRGKRIVYRAFYALLIAAIAALWTYAFRSYFDHYDSLHPEITWAAPWVQVDVLFSRGVFLWNETVLSAPRAGTVRYPKGTEPVRVRKGAVVARIASGGAAYDVRAPQEGYFVAGVDGAEGSWRYASLWPGTDEMPSIAPLQTIGQGRSVKKGDPIGKIVPQPQDLRFIGYVDLTGDVEKKLASNRVMVKMDPLDTPSRASVRVHEIIGHRAKVYLSLPWFPPGTLKTRSSRLIIEAGETSGLAIPETSVTVRRDTTGAFVLTGSEARFVPVKGRVIDGSRFLVTSGIKLGDAVIVDGNTAKEGRVKLW